MRFSTVFASAMAAAIVSAAPLEKRAITTDWVIETVTSYTTVFPSSTTPEPSSTPAVVAPLGALQQHHSRKSRTHRASTTTQAPPVPSTTEEAPVPSTTEEAPAPAPTTTEAAPAPSQPVTAPGSCPASASIADLSSPFDSCGVSVLDIANKWRVKYGKQPFEWSGSIAGAAKKTSNFNFDHNSMQHPGLVDGAMGECITPGFWQTGSLETQGLAPFEVALMGWLCEVGSDPELQPSANNGIDVCKISHKVALISGDVTPDGTGHHDIFLGDYKTIGIFYQDRPNKGDWPSLVGQWTADFGF